MSDAEKEEQSDDEDEARDSFPCQPSLLSELARQQEEQEEEEEAKDNLPRQHSLCSVLVRQKSAVEFEEEVLPPSRRMSIYDPAVKQHSTKRGFAAGHGVPGPALYVLPAISKASTGPRRGSMVPLQRQQNATLPPIAIPRPAQNKSTSEIVKRCNGDQTSHPSSAIPSSPMAPSSPVPVAPGGKRLVSLGICLCVSGAVLLILGLTLLWLAYYERYNQSVYAASVAVLCLGAAFVVIGLVIYIVVYKRLSKQKVQDSPELNPEASVPPLQTNGKTRKRNKSGAKSRSELMSKVSAMGDNHELTQKRSEHKKMDTIAFQTREVIDGAEAKASKKKKKKEKKKKKRKRAHDEQLK